MKKQALIGIIVCLFVFPLVAAAQARFPSTAQLPQRYQDALTKYEHSLDLLQVAKKNYQDVTSKERGNVSETINEQIEFEEAKRLVERGFDVIINYMDLLIVRVEETAALDETLKTEILDELKGSKDGYATTLTEIKDTVSDIGTLKTYAQQLTLTWQTQQQRLVIIKQKIKLARTFNLFAELRQLMQTIQQKFDEQKSQLPSDQQQDLETTIAQLTERLAELDQSLQTARETFSESDISAENALTIVNTNVSETKQLYKSLHALLLGS
jgi:hypothetical protein